MLRGERTSTVSAAANLEENSRAGEAPVASVLGAGETTKAADGLISGVMSANQSNSGSWTGFFFTWMVNSSPRPSSDGTLRRLSRDTCGGLVCSESSRPGAGLVLWGRLDSRGLGASPEVTAAVTPPLGSFFVPKLLGDFSADTSKSGRGDPAASGAAGGLTWAVAVLSPGSSGSLQSGHSSDVLGLDGKFPPCPEVLFTSESQLMENLIG